MNFYCHVLNLNQRHSKPSKLIFTSKCCKLNIFKSQYKYNLDTTSIPLHYYARWISRMHLILTLLKTNSSNYIGVISQLMPNQHYLHDERILDIQGDWIYPLSHFLFLIFISLELGWPISPPILPISLMVIIPSFVRETTFSTIFTPSPWFFTAAHHVEKPWASLEVTQGRHLTNAFTPPPSLGEINLVVQAQWA